MDTKKGIENPRIGGSIPSPATIAFNDKAHPSGWALSLCKAETSDRPQDLPAIRWRQRYFASSPRSSQQPAGALPQCPQGIALPPASAQLPLCVTPCPLMYVVCPVYVPPSAPWTVVVCEAVPLDRAVLPT